MLDQIVIEAGCEVAIAKYVSTPPSPTNTPLPAKMADGD